MTNPGGQPVRHPLFARFFNRVAGRNEVRGQAELRRELLAGLSGRVVELGAGTGLNFPHYPTGVAEVVAVEPETYLRQRAEEAARAAPVPITVVNGAADHIPAPTGEFDAAVVTGVLCSVPDPQVALAELRRVLRPDGQLRFYEHVRAAGGLRGAVQDAANVVWPRLMGGCHPNRDTRAALGRAGYRIETSRDLTFPPGSRFSPVAPRILGTARP
jgi:ubiquinone/menaquinone biosynthesis C-methylase UbiE